MGPARPTVFKRLLGSRQLDFGDFFALAYLVFFILEPLARRSTRYWLECAPLLLTFLVCWFSFLCSNTARTKRWIIVVVALLGIGTMPLNEPGGVCFLIYVISLVPYAVTAVPWQLSLMGMDLVLMYGLERWRHFPLSAMFFTLFFAIVGGGSNLFFAEKERNNCQLRLKQEEIEALAAVAERERIARDLHDVLGHTLSVIVLKTELAGRLVERELAERELAERELAAPSSPLSSRPEHAVRSGETPVFAPAQAGNNLDLTNLQRARAELADVERTARTALAEVREAIGGYRARGLNAEIEAARTTLATAGVNLRTEGAMQPAALSAGEESVLSLALREAVTNIVRHAQATECRLAVVQQNGRYRLSIQDDGQGTAAHEGNGLRGMRERVEGVGGHLSLSREAGTRLLIDIPLRSA